MDKILYTVVTEPGGVDGMDHTDRGGIIVLATFDSNQANREGTLGPVGWL